MIWMNNSKKWQSCKLDQEVEKSTQMKPNGKWVLGTPSIEWDDCLSSTIHLKSWVRCVKRWPLLRDRFWTCYCIRFSEMSLCTFHSLFMFDKRNELLWGVLIFCMPPSEPLGPWGWLMWNEWGSDEVTTSWHVFVKCLLPAAAMIYFVDVFPGTSQSIKLLHSK